MAATQIAKLNHRHQAVLNWLLCNPNRSKGECAQELGYTKTHLSIIINSDLFQAAYLQRAEEAGVIATHAITNRIAGIQGLILDEIEERVTEKKASERFLNDTSQQFLEVMGLAGKPSHSQPNQNQHLHVHVDAKNLSEARERLLGKSQEAA